MVGQHEHHNIILEETIANKSLAEPSYKTFPTVRLLWHTVAISRIPPIRGHTRRCGVHRARVTKVSAKKSEALALVTLKTSHA